jgi:hypothetical protein
MNDTPQPLDSVDTSSSHDETQLPMAAESMDESTLTVPDAMGTGFSLVRAIMIDSLAKGTRQIFSLEGGTVITGVNGRGKTSILQMLLLFYGSNPNQLVSKGKSSFIDYYLPNSTSYLVFEYQVPDASKRLVIAYANSTGEKVFYRFVRQGYDPRIFVDDNGCFIENRFLRQRLTKLNIPHSLTQIETYSDYRAVIQYNVPANVDRKHRDKLKAMCPDYAFTRYNKPLVNMDRLALGMFSKTSNFDVFKSITIEHIFENQSSYRVGTQRSAIETWPTQFKAYNEVMNAQDTYLQAKEVNLRCDDNYESLADLREKLEKLMVSLDDQAVINTTSIKEKKTDLSHAQAVFGEAHRVDSTQLTEHKLRIEHHQRDIALLDSEKAQYDALDIPSKHERYKTKNGVEADIKSMESRLAAMTESNTPIITRFERIQAEITQRFAQAQQAHVIEVTAVRTHSQENLDVQQQAHVSREEEAYKLHRAQREELQAQLETLIQVLGSCQQNLNSTHVPLAIQDALNTADQAFTAARKHYDQCHSVSDESVKTHLKTQAVLSKAQELVNRSTETLSKHAEKIERIIRDNTPAQASLLHFLRDQHPQWGETIGRVLRQDILHRTDLNPDLFSGDSVFGLHVSLDNLDACRESDPLYLQEMIEDEQRKKTTMEESHATLASALKTAQRDEGDAAKAVAEASRELLSSKSAMQVGESGKAQAEFEYKKAKNEAKSIAEKALAQVKSDIDASRTSLSACEGKYEQEKNLRKAQSQSLAAETKSARDEQLSRIENALNSKKVKHDVDIIEAQRECNKMLEDQGVDAKSVEALQRSIRDQKHVLNELDELLPTLKQWVGWFSSTYSKRQQVVDLCSDEQQAFNTLDQKIMAMTADHKKSVSAFEVDLEKLEATVATLSEEHKRGLSLVERLRPFVRPDRYEAVDSSWSVTIIAQL